MASSSSSSSPSAPDFPSRYSYHVFLSFRGDIRNNFVGHLYTALTQKGIQTFKDDKTLSRGKTIDPELMKAIKESQMAIVVLSERFGDSSYCLDELVQIMKCKKTRGQIVLPIFYKVDPSEVAEQKGKFGKAFEKHDPKEAKLGSWREALEAVGKEVLEAVGNISGFHYEDPVPRVTEIHGTDLPMCRDESKFLEDIVEVVSQNMRPLNSWVDTNLIGVEERMEELQSKLKIGSGGVRMIGIWGLGGGGKTTLAYSVYKAVSMQFNGCCYIENVSEKSSKKGLESLQKDLLCGVLNTKDVRVGGVEEGKQMIRDRLCTTKVLIVLDDVDHHDQLEALAGSVDWFGEDSRVIITTRNMNLLDVLGIVVHNMSLLSKGEGIKLFRKHAFRTFRPMEGFELLSEEAVSYAGGLPLALRVFGRLLCGKDMHEWTSALARLKEIPDDEILEKLKISFEGLKPVEKELFLDIACFFRQEHKDEAMKELDACGFHPVIGVKVLIEKALISISEYGRFVMHDLIQEMGHYIVTENNTKNPEKHSRIWREKDVVNICALDPMPELDMIEAIRYKYSGFSHRDNPLQDLPPIVANTKNLRWIDWEGDLASPSLTNFPQRTLCCLKLYGSTQEKLWEGRKRLPNLKIMELTCLNKLIMTPDFDGIPNLERFTLHECDCLEEVHPSFGCLERLVFLSIEDCSSLKMFPPITRLEKLKTVSFSKCPKLDMLSKFKQQTRDSLQHLHLDNSGKEIVPHNNMSHHTGSLFFPRGLRKLELWYCNVGDKDIGSAVWDLPNLEELILAGNKFSRLNFSLLQIPRLKRLDVSFCHNLVELSELPSSIAVLRADWCTSLESFGDVSNCKWLWKVSHRKGNKLVGDILLHSMLQGNAVDDHCISVSLDHQIPKGFVGGLFRGETFRLHLPDDWHNDFCGFLICIVTHIIYPNINIIIEHEVDEDSRFEIWQESNEAVEHEYDGSTTSIGYVSFNSLKHTALLNSLYNLISFSLEDTDGGSFYVGAELVPRKSKGDEVQTTDCSEFWDKESEHGTTFTIQRDSKSSFKILWRPYYYKQEIVVKVDVPTDRDMRKAMKVAVGVSGIESIAMDMKIGKTLTVIGDVNPIDIARKLKKYWHTEIVSAGPTKGWR